MMDVPRRDTQSERHAQLLLCMFKPFFKMYDLRLLTDESWEAALVRTEDSNAWGARTASMRMNIEGMLRQRLAAADEIARKAEEARLTRAGCGGRDADSDDEILNDAFDDETEGTNVMPMAPNAHNVLAYVNDAKDACLDAGFSRNDHGTSTMLSGRSQQAVDADASRVIGGHDSDDAATALTNMKKQERALKSLDSRAAESTVDDDDIDEQADPSVPYSSAALDPYLLELRSRSESGLSAEKIAAMDSRRKATNAAVAASDIGQTYPAQHDAVKRIADEFGLNRKQRLAFFIFGAAWIARGAVPTADSLRLHVSGGAGSGKSWVLSAVLALIECKALSGTVRPGKLLTVAFQGKQASSVGGATVHSVADIPRGDKQKDNLLDNTEGQSPLDAAKAARWRGVEVLAIEEVSMVSCKLLGHLHKAAAYVRPSWSSLPFAGLIVITFGDLNQVCCTRVESHELDFRTTSVFRASLRSLFDLFVPTLFPPFVASACDDLPHQLEPVSQKSVVYGIADPDRLKHLTQTELSGHRNFYDANASVVLNESNNRFSETYSPIMDRLLRGECTPEDVLTINARVLSTEFRLPDGSYDKLSMKHCWMAQTITFRNTVSSFWWYQLLIHSRLVFLFGS